MLVCKYVQEKIKTVQTSSTSSTLVSSFLAGCSYKFLSLKDKLFKSLLSSLTATFCLAFAVYEFSCSCNGLKLDEMYSLSSFNTMLLLSFCSCPVKNYEF